MLKKLYQTRKNKNISVYEMAKKLSMSCTQYRKIERGQKKLYVKETILICDILNETIDDLFYDDILKIINMKKREK